MLTTEKVLPFVLAAAFVLIWIIWSVTRNRMRKDGTDETRQGKRTLALWETLALLDVIGFGFSVYSIWK